MSSSGLKDLSKDELIGLVEQLLAEISALRERVGALEAENAALREENGIERDLHRRLQVAVTVVTGSAAFDPRVASPEALHALPFALQAWSNRLVGFELSEPMTEPLPGDPSVTATRQRFYTVRSLACLRPQGAQFLREAIVKLDRRSTTEPFQIMAWKQPLFFKASLSTCKP